MKKIFKQYKSLLKPLPLEGGPDLLVFRPVAFILVQILKRFPVTPNQVSFSAIFTGLIAAVAFATGTRQGFLIAGIFYGLTVTLDCADGMLARLKKSGTLMGRIIDGVVDYVNSFAIMLGLAIGTAKMHLALPLGWSSWIWLSIAGFPMILHCMVVDYYRNQFAIHGLGTKDPDFDETREFERLYKESIINKRHLLERIVLWIATGYSRVQKNITVKSRHYDRKKYYRKNILMLRLWLSVELSMHIVVLMITGFLYDPRIFMVYSILIANAMMLILAPIQYFINKQVEIKPPPRT